LNSLGANAKLIDLREHNIPFCDGTDAYDHPDSVMIRKEIEEADTVILAVPIYNFDVNSAAKNLLEIAMRAWTYKVVGFLCAAGGQSSYMSVMGCANHLMLDFRCVIVPRFVYATGNDFGDDRRPTMFVESEKVQDRIRELVDTTVKMTQALDGVFD
jgi:NAD(P)H-dependent FMN reductase